jgi:uncharacterized membrane protein YdjX (TVP38/TMEM64 family)
MMFSVDKKTFGIVGILLTAILCCVYFFSADLFKFFSLETLQCHARELAQFVQVHYVLSVLLYLLTGIIGILFFLPIVTLYMLTAGFLFGPWIGAFYAVIGVTVGALLVCAFIRSTVGQWVHKYEAQLVTINKFITAYGFYAVLLLRASHLVPFFLLNIAAALMPISLSAFTLATFLGAIPGSLLFAWTGQYLCSITSVWDVISFNTLLIIGGCVVLLLCCLLLVRFLMRKNSVTF